VIEWLAFAGVLGWVLVAGTTIWRAEDEMPELMAPVSGGLR
jgi:hypothetical protein